MYNILFILYTSMIWLLIVARICQKKLRNQTNEFYIPGIVSSIPSRFLYYYPLKPVPIPVWFKFCMIVCVTWMCIFKLLSLILIRSIHPLVKCECSWRNECVVVCNFELYSTMSIIGCVMCECESVQKYVQRKVQPKSLEQAFLYQIPPLQYFLIEMLWMTWLWLLLLLYMQNIFWYTFLMYAVDLTVDELIYLIWLNFSKPPLWMKKLYIHLDSIWNELD